MRSSSLRTGALAACLIALAVSCGESDRSVGEITGGPRAAELRTSTRAAQSAARAGVGSDAAGEILFGDLHVHTTFSIDAFLQALPIFGGEGVHPPADACDFARHCAGLDFFSLNDHAESLYPERWRESLESVRECNARATGESPDVIAYMGYEWTQAGPTPATHWGHKNVVFRGLGDDDVAPRPIDSLPANVADRARAIGIVEALAELESLGIWSDLMHLLANLANAAPCEAGVDTRDLPADCRESAETPAALFEKLAQAGHDTVVIPHGLAWGQHAPPGSRLETQLAGRHHDPGRQRLLEVFSGHGNSEEFRAAHRYSADENGDIGECPAPSDDFLPCCWRAGELMRERCGDLPADECDARVEEAKRLALEAKTAPNLVFPETSAEEWLDCDQCRDCFKPVFNPRPGMTAQYSAAVRGDEGERFRFGFIASSDNHTGRPGTGYKQFARHGMTDVRGFRSERLDAVVRPFVLGTSDDPQRAQPVPWEERGFRGLFNKERVASFLYPGGLVAVHAERRDRDAVWRALEERRVYGTSGPRILLWFDLLGEEGSAERMPMGSDAKRAVGSRPRFEVRAVGARVQRAGCADATREALGDERLAALCLGECHNPGDGRHRIERIEVVRIRPQLSPDEDVATLIEDPWRVLDCEDAGDGCVARFDDPHFTRDTVYYVRAIQEATDAVNGANLRTTFAGVEGSGTRQARSVEPCHAGWRTPWDDDCLAPVNERAWSSPIFLDTASDAAIDPGDTARRESASRALAALRPEENR